MRGSQSSIGRILHSAFSGSVREEMSVMRIETRRE